jgi:arsenite methyltransferase
MLRYNPDELVTIPAECTASFAGLGNPHRIGPIVPGETILDVGCGSGVDLLLAARRTGVTGRAIGIDMTPSMIERAKCAALKTGLWQNVEIRRGTAEELTVQSGTIDVVISNAMLNLSSDKRRVFSEIYRVLRPGGRLYLADVVVQRELSTSVRTNINLWVA